MPSGYARRMSLSESASSQVQAILEAAEASAEQIKRDAEAEAQRIRSAARETREADVSGLVELVAKVRADLDALEARLKGLESEAPQAAEVKPVAAAPKPPAAAKPKAATPAANSSPAPARAHRFASGFPPRSDAPLPGFGALPVGAGWRGVSGSGESGRF